MFKQNDGLPMRSRLSGLLVTIAMDDIERRCLLNTLNIIIYKRYVDDIFCLTTNEEMADTIYLTFNNSHPKIKFEIEKPLNNGKLSLLDQRVTACFQNVSFCYGMTQRTKYTWINFYLFLHDLCSFSSMFQMLAMLGFFFCVAQWNVCATVII